MNACPYILQFRITHGIIDACPPVLLHIYLVSGYMHVIIVCSGVAKECFMVGHIIANCGVRTVRLALGGLGACSSRKM